MDKRISCFDYWCFKVLPLVYDESLSYYELLCKIYTYINNLIDEQKDIVVDIDTLKKEMTEVKQWIDNFDTSYLEQLVEEYLGKVVKNVVFGISSGGYFVAYIPENWNGIEFGTIQDGDLYGHLTLSYD